MLKKLLIGLAVLIFSASALAGDYYREVDTVTNLYDSVLDTLFTSEYSVLPYNAVMMSLVVTQTDSTKDDSFTVSLQQKNYNDWVDVIAAINNDTVSAKDTVSYWYNLDSLLVNNIQSALRFRINFVGVATADTADSESVVPDADEGTNDFTYSTGDSNYKCIDDDGVDADSSDYIFATAADEWDAWSLADHANEEFDIDSVVMYSQMSFGTGSTWVSIGITVTDTSNAVWGDTLIALTDSATKVHGVTFTTDAGGDTWTREAVDSTYGVIKTDSVQTNDTTFVYSVWYEVFYTKGELEPDIIYETHWILKDKDIFAPIIIGK